MQMIMLIDDVADRSDRPPPTARLWTFGCKGVSNNGCKTVFDGGFKQWLQQLQHRVKTLG